MSRSIYDELARLQREIERLKSFEIPSTGGGITQAVAIKSSTYTLTADDAVVVFTATATANLPAATGSGRTYRIIDRAGTLTIDANGTETIKGSTTVTLFDGEDIILTDTAAGKWE